MRIEISVSFGNRDRDVLIEAADTAPIAAVLPGLADAVGAPADSSIWCGTDLLPPETPITDSRLRTGVRLRLGAALAPSERSGVLALQVVGGPAAGRVLPLGRGRLTIGRAPDNDLVLPDPGVSRRHAVLEISDSAIRVHDAGSANGTWLDGKRLTADDELLPVGSIVRLGDSLLSLAGPVGTPASVDPGPDGSLLLRRSPRRPDPAPQQVIVLPDRVSPGPSRGVQWITALLPAIAGCTVAWISRQPQFLLFALLSPAMLISTALGDRLHWRRTRRRAAAGYRRQRADAERRISEGLTAEVTRRRTASPDPATLRRIVAGPGTRVWERRRDDADLLHVAVGSADLSATLTVREDGALTPAATLAAVPLCVDLRRGPLGVAGPADVTAALGRWLVGQLAALTAPADLELALAVPPGREPDWTWARWLPHLRGRVAIGAAEAATLVEELAALVEQRSTVRRGTSEGWRGGWLVVVVDRTAGGRHPAGLTAVLERGADLGVTAVWLDTDRAALPGCCATVARVDGLAGTRVVLGRADGTEVGAVADQVSLGWSTDLARGLAPLVEDGGSGATALPATCGLLETLDLAQLTPEAVAGRWAASDGAAHTVLGVGADGVLHVDLAAEGPHTLIAGTTGAGKSELLRTLVAGLAAAHPPEDMTVLLVDYKGGAAFAGCAMLPHAAGLVTDLDAYLTERALRSLHSELRRRERLFATVGAADLDEYRARCGPEPVPRLVVVVDEFATLADELPGFLAGLVGVAQRGRSLGIHLVLATQRPGRAISAEIRANTTLRIALRVTDAGESSDVIDSPLAATIERTRPGRGYLRAGSALTCFQTAHSSSASPINGVAGHVRPLGAWRRPGAAAANQVEQADLARLVDTLQLAARQRGCAPAKALWQAPLPDILWRTELHPPSRREMVTLGRVDLPDEQRLAALDFDLAAGASLLVTGSAQSGRTTALASLGIGAATALRPDELHLHVVDGTGALADLLGTLPHCATVLRAPDCDLAPRLLRRLVRASTDRLARRSAAGPARPTLLLLLDGWDTVCAALPDADAIACTDLLATLLRVAGAAGLAIAVTADRGGATSRFAGGFGERVVLGAPDRGDFGGVRRPTLPSVLRPGRGVRYSDGALVQFAQAAREIGRSGSCGDLGPSAIRIRPLPQQVRLSELPAQPGRLTLGMAGDEPVPVAIDPFAGSGRWLVAGLPRSGRSSTLQLLAGQARAADIATLVAAPVRSPLSAHGHRLGMQVIDPSDGVVPAPQAPTLLLVDDVEVFIDSRAGDLLAGWARFAKAPLVVVAAGRTDDLATSFRGIGAEVRRSRCGILLRPGPIDGELFGVRLARGATGGPPGRGVAVGDPSWGALFADGEPVPIQVAVP